MAVTETEARDTTGVRTTDPDAAPFAQVDSFSAPMRAKLLAALEDMAGTPQIAQVRRQANAMLQPTAGEQILDAGCGAGEVARELAAMVGPGGQITAIDASQATVDYAASKDGGAGVQYRVADLNALPFADGTFDAVRCERVLQHIPDPDRSVAELVRVTRAGGRVCLIDTDWHSLALDGMPDDLVNAMTAAFLSEKANHHKTMGRTLRRRLVRAGLADVSAQPVAFSFSEASSAAELLPMFDELIPAEFGLMPAELRDPWFEAVAAADARGELLAALTMWVAVGTRP